MDSTTLKNPSSKPKEQPKAPKAPKKSALTDAVQKVKDLKHLRVTTETYTVGYEVSMSCCRPPHS